jgi:ankyrin repeat protein
MTVQLLLHAEGIDVNKKGLRDLQAVHHSLIDGNDDVLKALLDYGADPDSTYEVADDVADVFTSFPLLDAVALGRRNAVRILLEAGANVDAKNNDGWSALMVALDRDDVPIIKLLLDYNASTSPWSIGGRALTALALSKSDQARDVLLSICPTLTPGRKRNFPPIAEILMRRKRNFPPVAEILMRRLVLLWGTKPIEEAQSLAWSLEKRE